VALVLLSLSLSGEGVGLAGKPSCEYINSSSVSCRVEFFDVSMLYGVWEVMFQDLSRELFPLAVEDVVPTHPLGGQVETTDPGKERRVVHVSLVGSRTFNSCSRYSTSP
jgi:hypothetical protein